MIITFRDRASIPSKLHNFYALAFEALYYRHDASKTVKRPTLTNLPVNKGKDILAAFSVITYISNQTIFSYHDLKDLLNKAMKLSDCQSDINDLISDFLRAYCMLLQDGTRYQYTHRSFQEYFSACYLVSESDSNLNKLITKLLFNLITKKFNLSGFFQIFLSWFLYSPLQEHSGMNYLVRLFFLYFFWFYLFLNNCFKRFWLVNL